MEIGPLDVRGTAAQRARQNGVGAPSDDDCARVAPEPGSGCLTEAVRDVRSIGEPFAAFAAHRGEGPAGTIRSHPHRWIALSPDASLDLGAEDLVVMHLMAHRWIVVRGDRCGRRIAASHRGLLGVLAAESWFPDARLPAGQ